MRDLSLRNGVDGVLRQKKGYGLGCWGVMILRYAFAFVMVMRKVLLTYHQRIEAAAAKEGVVQALKTLKGLGDVDDFVVDFGN
jgi:hypothetical protein